MRRGPLAGLALAVVVGVTAGCVAAPAATTAPVPVPAPAPTASGAGPAGPSPSASDATASGPGPTPAPGTCAALVAGLTPAQRVGQLFVVGVRGTLDQTERAALVDRSLGSVILMGGAPAAATTAAIAGLPTPLGVLVAVDQEGGAVQRFTTGGFTRIPPASEQAALGDAALRDAWRQWGGQLRDAGIHLDFAPVADVVPAAKVRTNEPVGKLRRGYGSTPAVVGGKVAAVVAGLDAAGVGSSAKHFPGLGEVVGNTDFATGVVDRVTGSDSASLDAFRAAIAAGVDTVMVATATYPRIDPDNQAAFSPAVMRLLRDDLGFAGVVVSDDLGAARAVAGVAPAQRALRFLRAGGDWVVVVEPGPAVTMADAVVAASASDPALARRVDESALRVLELKARRGVVDCLPG